jgi:50S ribosomal protein L16 3-hydroxylase
VSARKYPDIDWRPEEPIAPADLRARLAGRPLLCRSPGSRFSFVREGAGSVCLFADGQSFDCGNETAALAERLCADLCTEVDPQLLECDAAMTLIVQLFNQGSLTFADED